MVKLAIFDLDGTLVNSIEDLADAANRALAENGYPTKPLENFNYYVGNGTKKLIERAMPENTPLDEQERIHEIFSSYYREHCLDKTKPYDGILQLLDRLKEAGIICTVASNKPDAFSKQIVSSVFAEGVFEFVRGKVDGANAKPAPDVVLAIMDKFGVVSENAVMIGDSDVDVLTAHNANIKCIGCEWGFRGRDELENAGADYIAKEPNDIFDFLI